MQYHPESAPGPCDSDYLFDEFVQMMKLLMSMHDLKHKCGVFGIFGIDEAAVLTTLGLHSLQHRGQEGAGIVSYDGKSFHSIKKEGLVGDNFNDSETLSKLPGSQAVGHVRYSTTGNPILIMFSHCLLI